MFKAAVFCNSQKDYPVDNTLHGEIQISHRQPRISQGDIARENLPPAFDFTQESCVHFGSAALAPA
jgi:hypothetical protein